MTTKEQERKALEQIEKILASLDADGYVNTAFAGVLDVARENIENDWVCSMQERAELAERLQANAETERDTARAMRDRADERTAEARRDAEAWRATAQDLQAQANAQGARIAELESAAEAQELKILRLKARLYDAEHAGV